MSRRVRATWLAMRRRIAVGMPRGRSLVVSLGSLWIQNKQTSVKKRLMHCGSLFWYMRSKMKCRSGLTVGIEDLTRVMNRSMVSAFIPDPLFLAAWRMVLQMSPGRENG